MSPITCGVSLSLSNGEFATVSDAFCKSSIGASLWPKATASRFMFQRMRSRICLLVGVADSPAIRQRGLLGAGRHRGTTICGVRSIFELTEKVRQPVDAT